MVAGESFNIGAGYTDAVEELADCQAKVARLEDELKHLRWELFYHKQLAAEYRGLKLLLTLIQSQPPAPASAV